MLAASTTHSYLNINSDKTIDFMRIMNIEKTIYADSDEKGQRWLVNDFDLYNNITLDEKIKLSRPFG